MKVTRIEGQQRRKGRYSVYIDEVFYAGMDEAILVESGLRLGQELSPSELADLDKLLDLEKVRESALRSLSIRLNSTAELRRKLSQKKFESELVEETIQWLTGKGLLDDQLFAERWSDSRRTGSGLGARRIYGELLRKGIDKEIIQSLGRPTDEEEISSALTFLEKKFSRDSIHEQREKAMRSLAARGFDYSTIRAALQRFSETES